MSSGIWDVDDERVAVTETPCPMERCEGHLSAEFVFNTMGQAAVVCDTCDWWLLV